MIQKLFVNCLPKLVQSLVWVSFRIILEIWVGFGAGGLTLVGMCVLVSFGEQFGGLGPWRVEVVVWAHFGVRPVGLGGLSFCGGCILGYFGEHLDVLGAGRLSRWAGA